MNYPENSAQSKLIKNFQEDKKYNLKHQMEGAKLSITNNTAEGYSRYYYKG